MARRYLLDSNICAALIRAADRAVTQKFFQVGWHHTFINWVVVGELRFGVKNKNSPVLLARVEQFIAEMNVLDAHPDITHHYADIRHELTQQGQLIGVNDLWIAAHARAEDLILVSNNTREFSRVSGLQLEDWLSTSTH